MTPRRMVGGWWNPQTEGPEVAADDGSIWFRPFSGVWMEVNPVPGTEAAGVEAPDTDPHAAVVLEADQPSLAAFLFQTRSEPNPGGTETNEPGGLVVDCYRYGEGKRKNPSYVARRNVENFDLAGIQRHYGGGRWHFRLKDRKGRLVKARNVNIEGPPKSPPADMEKDPPPSFFDGPEKRKRRDPIMTGTANSILGVCGKTLLHLERFGALHPTRTKGGMRRFDGAEVEALAEKYAHCRTTHQLLRAVEVDQKVAERTS